MSLAICTQAILKNFSGDVFIAPNSIVEVRREIDNVIATIFSDVNAASQLGNPFNCDQEGMFTFYAVGLARGYKITISNTSGTRVLRNVAIGTAAEYDASDAVGPVLNSATLAAFRTAIGAISQTEIDAAIIGLDQKPSVKCATTANITLSGEQTLDGILTSASRVLVKNQSTASQNGIYVSAAGAWARAADMDVWTEVPDAFVFVEQGSTQADTGWLCTSDSGGTIGSTSMAWSQFPAANFSIGKTAIPIPATALTPRSANGCALIATSAGAANQPDIPYLAFDGAAKEYAGFFMKMPKSWNESTITVAFDWRRASGTGAANVVWGVRAVAVSDGDTGAATFGSDATVTDAAQTVVANWNLSAETAACTIGGSPAELDLVFFEVFRDGASGSDTLDGVDAWLSCITLFITLNAVNDA